MPGSKWSALNIPPHILPTLHIYFPYYMSKKKSIKHLFNSWTRSGSTAIKQVCSQTKIHFALTEGRIQSNQQSLFFP